MKSQKTSISVCMATYNGSFFIRAQIESILFQTLAIDELIIIDDGSIDGTDNIVNQYLSDKRIRYIKNDNRLGVIKNFELAVSQAVGDYIFLCDQDDIWMENKVQICIDSLKYKLLVVTDCVVVDNDLNELYPSFFSLRDSGEGIIKNIYKNSYLGCCMAFKRDLLVYALPFPSQIPMHDMWLGIIAECYGVVDFVPQKLSLYRRHKSAASSTARKSSYGVLSQIKFRFNLMCSILTRVFILKIKKI